MKKNIRIMIITVAAVIILVAMLLILMNLPSSDGGGASSTASSTSISLNTKTADDVSKVEVKNDSDSYTVEMKSEDSYSVEGLDGFDLNKTSISALKSDSAGVAATQLVEEQAEDLSIYGLDSPKAEATITYKDGETLSLAVGNEAAGDAGTYVTVNGESRVTCSTAPRWIPSLTLCWSMLPRKLHPPRRKRWRRPTAERFRPAPTDRRRLLNSQK